jgi:hypothetical protein
MESALSVKIRAIATAAACASRRVSHQRDIPRDTVSRSHRHECLANLRPARAVLRGERANGWLLRLISLGYNALQLHGRRSATHEAAQTSPKPRTSRRHAPRAHQRAQVRACLQAHARSQTTRRDLPSHALWVEDPPGPRVHVEHEDRAFVDHGDVLRLRVRSNAIHLHARDARRAEYPPVPIEDSSGLISRGMADAVTDASRPTAAA